MLNSQEQGRDPSFLGAGWSFPPTFNPHGAQVEMSVAEADILQSIQIILQTQPGERLMWPNFGCELSQYVFESMDQGLFTSIQSIVSDALTYHEPRIRVDRLEVNPSPTTPGLLLIEVDYTVRQTNTRSNLVYPFYINEATDTVLSAPSTFSAAGS